MQNSDVPVSPAPHIERVAIRDFPFEDAILLEECDCYDVEALRKYFRGSAVFLLAKIPWQLTDAVEGSSHVGDLVGFLVAETSRDEDGEVYGSLVNLAVSCMEEDPDAIRVALIRRWQEECREELLDGLQASILPKDEGDRAVFLGEKFEPIGTCPCCDAEVLQWRSGVQQSDTL